jgi:FKBP-type peptidyl-prolyl cis-trans isomerase FklB
MNKKLLTAAVLGVFVTNLFALENGKYTTDLEKISYSIGADLGKNFKQQDIEIIPSILAKGMDDSMNGRVMQLTDDQMKEFLTKFQKSILEKRQQKYEKQSSDNKAKGEKFLKDNKSKSGVVTLPSGLQYKIINSGNGVKPTKNDTVTVEYTGTNIDGNVFDSTEKSGKPATFKLDQVIPGWTEALQLMPSGSTWEVYIPADLAYGQRSPSPMIGPNETLIFKIHLISVKKS